jgi:hypothetical protein
LRHASLLDFSLYRSGVKRTQYFDVFCVKHSRSHFMITMPILLPIQQRCSPIIILSTIHCLLPRLQRFGQTASKTSRSRSVLTRWCCCATVAISVATVSWRRVQPRFPPDRTFCRRCRWSRLRPCCSVHAGSRSRRGRSRWRRRTRGSWRRWRRRLLDFFEIGGRRPARGRMVETLCKPPSCDVVSSDESQILGCSAYHCFLAV